MLAQSARSTTTSVHTTTSSATPVSPVSPSRSSRLRGLSYLRNCTHDRLLSSRSDAPPLTRSTSSPVSNTISALAGSSGGRETTAEPEEDPRSTITMDANNTTRDRAMTAASATAAPESVTQPPAATSSNAHRTETHPTIRFIPHLEMRSSRPSLHFTTVTKTLKNARGVIKVGRYTERDQTGSSDGTLAVGFKSKVVSRRHCEFWCTDGQWFVKDVKSSSGTFLNHVRLSSPGVESRPYPVNDGDVVQLGIDFKGGEEVIFRCVKIRIECNRGWQKALNNYNTSTHKNLLSSVAAKAKADSDTASVSSHECSICLNPVSPCQCLFVAPCSHVWHYKCVRNLVHGPNWPNFLCPNCRFVADLEADVEPPEEEDLDHEVEPEHDEGEHDSNDSSDPRSAANSAVDGQEVIEPSDTDQTASLPRIDVAEQAEGSSESDSAAEARLEARLASDSSPSPAHAAQPVSIASKTAVRRANSPRFIAFRPAPSENSARFAPVVSMVPDHLLTPRNDAGPFILDGAAGRATQ